VTGTSPLVRKKWQRFRKIRRGYVSLVIVISLYILSLGSDLIANNKAIIVRYEGRYFFPFLQYYPESLFGGATNAEPNYRALKVRLASEGGGNWALMPLIPYGPYETLLELPGSPPNPPSSEHWLGTDDRGRDVLVRLLYGFRISMTFSLEVTIFATILGVFIGALQGYYGGKFDLLVQRLIEIWATLPFLYIVIIISSIFEPSFHWLAFMLFLFSWMGMTFYMRGEFYREKSRDYVMAAKALGATDTRIIFRHILPNALTPIITFLPFSLVGNIFALTSLDFLGFGLPAPTPSWGELMQQGMGNIYSYWLSLSPVAALFFTLLLITFVGEAAREAFDPRQYQRLV
jgi:microcin C transport system permease protein